MKAFIFDPLWDDLVNDELTEKLSNSGLEVIVTKTVAPLKENKELYEGDEERILCLNPDYVKWKLDTEDYKDIPNLKGIFGAATNTAWIDKSYANKNNIPVCDIKNFSTEAVAEWVITTMLNVARQIPRLIKDDFPLDFDQDFIKYRGVELHGKKAGIIGLGHIGAAIAKRCSGLGMEVVYWNRSPKDSNYKRVELKDLYEQSDVVVPALAFNDETAQLVTTSALETMKTDAMLISFDTHLVDNEKAAAMVGTGKLFGFGFEAEPQSFNKYEGNVWAAPAYAWATDQTMHNAMVKWVENMVNAAKGDFPNRINH